VLEKLSEQPVSLIETIRAREVIKPYLTPTQCLFNSRLSKLLGADVYIKYENQNPTGSFKIRGGINLMASLSKLTDSGVITFSTGNHGLSMATSAALFNIPATIVVPDNNTPAKNRKILETDAELIETGQTFEQASQAAEELCQQRGLYYVHPANQPQLINGVGTEFLEIIETVPDLDAVIVPIGAGSEVAAAITTLKTINPSIQIYAVQAESSNAAWNSWKSGEIQTAENTTFAGGFATGIAYDLPFSIYKNAITDFVLLSEDEIYSSIALAAYYSQTMLEGAGASTIMAAIKLKQQLKGKKVALQFSGCNASANEIHKACQLKEFESGFIA
jgi:threonine dehydratase